MLVFVEGGKPENPEKNPRSNNRHMYGTGPESNSGHIGGRRVLEGNLLCYVRASAHERALMTQTYDTIRYDTNIVRSRDARCNSEESP